MSSHFTRWLPAVDLVYFVARFGPFCGVDWYPFDGENWYTLSYHLQEPITPFLERALDLWEKAGISLILVVGSCGAYFHIASQVIQMDAYHARDITAQAKAVLADRPIPTLSAPGFHLPSGGRVVDLSGNHQTRKNYRGDGCRQERLKVKRFGKTTFPHTEGDF